jgi:hypothetical protein
VQFAEVGEQELVVPCPHRAPRLGSGRVTRVLKRPIGERGWPEAVRSDNGPEFNLAPDAGLVGRLEGRAGAYPAGPSDAERTCREDGWPEAMQTEAVDGVPSTACDVRFESSSGDGERRGKVQFRSRNWPSVLHSVFQQVQSGIASVTHHSPEMCVAIVWSADAGHPGLVWVDAAWLFCPEVNEQEVTGNNRGGVLLGSRVVIASSTGPRQTLGPLSVIKPSCSNA